MRRTDKKNDGRRRKKWRRNGVRRGKRDVWGATEGEESKAGDKMEG